MGRKVFSGKVFPKAETDRLPGAQFVLLDFVIDAARGYAHHAGYLRLIAACELKRALQQRLLTTIERLCQVPIIQVKYVLKVRLRINIGLSFEHGRLDAAVSIGPRFDLI